MSVLLLDLAACSNFKITQRVSRTFGIDAVCKVSRGVYALGTSRLASMFGFFLANKRGPPVPVGRLGEFRRVGLRDTIYYRISSRYATGVGVCVHSELDTHQILFIFTPGSIAARCKVSKKRLPVTIG